MDRQVHFLPGVESVGTLDLVLLHSNVPALVISLLVLLVHFAWRIGLLSFVLALHLVLVHLFCLL